MDQEQSGLSEIPSPLQLPTPDGFWHRAAELNRFVMLAAPLSPIAIGMMAGIVAGERIGLDPVSFALILALASVAAWSPLRKFGAFVLLFVAGTGVGGILHWSRERVVPPGSIEHFIKPGGTIIRVRGRINSEPNIPTKNEGLFSAWQFQEEQTAFLLRVEDMECEDGWRAASGTIRVTIREAVLDLKEGDTIELFGRLVDLAPPQNPGAFDWRSYYRLQGVVARMYCDQRENIVRLARECGGFASWLRAKTRGLLTDDIAASAVEESSLLEAMVLGHRSRFDRRLNEVFTRAGCVHFIAASGTNIVVLMSAVWFACRMIGFEKRRCAWLMIVAIVLYGVVAEARPPILRACIMGLMFCFALLLRRATSHMNWICAAAIVLCLFDPMTVFDAGFQLSFAAVLGVAYLAPSILAASTAFYWWFRHAVLRDPYARADQHLRKIAVRFAPPSPRQRVMRTIGRFMHVLAIVVAVSVGAWLVNLPITASWFQRIQPWGVVSTVVIYPLMSMVMVLGFIKVGLAGFSPTLAWVLSGVLSAIESVMIRLVEWMADLPAASPAVTPSPSWLIAAFYTFLVAFTLAFRTRHEESNPASEKKAGPIVSEKNIRSWVCILLSLAVLIAAGTAWQFNGKKGSRLTVTVLSVGAGTAVVMELPDGGTILYDAGSLGVSELGKNVIAPFLRHRGIHHIDRLYVSHPNLDHFSGIPELITEIPTGPIVLNHCFESLSPPRSPARRLVKHLSTGEQPTEALGAHQTHWETGGVLFEKLWPPAGSCANLTANDSSTVLRVTFQGHSLLLTGDIAQVAERTLSRTSNLRADVLLLPHHGSVCPGTGEFLKSVSANVLVRSSNQRITYTDNGLQQLIGNTAMYNTADCGAVTIVIDKNGMQIETWIACHSD